MAGYEGAMARIRGELWRDKYPRNGSPTTISVKPWGDVYSYGMRIGECIDQDMYYVVRDGCSSCTTNRHIRALVRVLEAEGFDLEHETQNGRRVYMREVK